LKKIQTSVSWINIIRLGFTLEALNKNLNLLFIFLNIWYLSFSLIKKNKLIKRILRFFQLDFNNFLFLFFFFHLY